MTSPLERSGGKSPSHSVLPSATVDAARYGSGALWRRGDRRPRRGRRTATRQFPVAHVARSHKRCDGNACRSFAWRSLVDCFIHGSSSWRSGARGGGRRAHVRCVRAGLWRKRPSRGCRPRQAFGVMPSRGKVPRQRWKPLSRPLQACGGSPGLERQVLSRIGTASGTPSRGDFPWGGKSLRISPGLKKPGT